MPDPRSSGLDAHATNGTNGANGANGANGGAPVLELEGVAKAFAVGARGLGRRGAEAETRSVDGVDLSIAPHETLGLVGESGSGKSTTARLALRLLEPTAGRVRWRGRDVTGLRGRALRQARVDVQAVFQDTNGALNQAMTVVDVVAEPLRVHGGLSRAARRDRAEELLLTVGLSRRYLDRYPYELSGGQRQRLGIARALVLRPRLLVLDEPVSALDVSTQSQVINLFQDLQDEIGTAYLFIAHDLYVVHHLSQRIAVMYLGRIVEVGDADQVYERPRHPYTQALLSAIPEPDPVAERRRRPIVLTGESPGPTSVPAGCPFHTRCPHVMDLCRHEEPELTRFADGGEVRCHLHTHAQGPELAGASVSTLPLPVAGSSAVVA